MRSAKGFTLIELLVVMAILALLFVLLVPAVESAREAGRRSQCMNHLRQLGVAALSYEAAHKSFPHGGWGFMWAPVPGRGGGERQPGGWMWSLLPFLEQENLRGGAAEGDTGGVPLVTTASGNNLPAHLACLTQPLAVAHCPSRRPARNYPIAPGKVVHLRPYEDLIAGALARGDYAMNCGPRPMFTTFGPDSLEHGDQVWGTFPPYGFVGISHYRRGAKMHQIVDGASETYMMGEKYLYVDHYDNGESAGDDASLYSGYSMDNFRFTHQGIVPSSDTSPYRSDDGVTRFGSAHPGGCHFIYCDGHVDMVAYDVDPLIHCRHGHRSDSLNSGECP